MSGFSDVHANLPPSLPGPGDMLNDTITGFRVTVATNFNNQLFSERSIASFGICSTDCFTSLTGAVSFVEKFGHTFNLCPSENILIYETECNLPELLSVSAYKIMVSRDFSDNSIARRFHYVDHNIVPAEVST